MRNTGFLLPLIRDIESILRAASVGLEETEARVSVRTQQRIRRFHAFNTLCSTFLRATANTSTLCACVRERALGQEASTSYPSDRAGSPPHDIGSPRDLVTADSGFAKDAVARVLVHLHQMLYRDTTSCPFTPLRHAHTYDAMLPCVSRGDAVAAASSPPPAQPLPRDVTTLARAIVHSSGSYFQAILSADNTEAKLSVHHPQLRLPETGNTSLLPAQHNVTSCT